ncbi:MAG: hypothetical protein ACRDIA_01930 [Actinomycetota bacterium]
MHFFKYSRALSRVTGRRPEEALASRAFDALFPDLVLGSTGAAVAVADLAADHVAGGRTGAIAYLSDLLAYEKAMMAAEAGPRRWRDEQAGNGVQEGPYLTPESTRLLELEFDITQVLVPLLGEWTMPPEAPKRPVRLLVARSEHGRVIVAHSTPEAELLIRLGSRARGLEDFVKESGLDGEEMRRLLGDLVEWGALTVSRGS